MLSIKPGPGWLEVPTWSPPRGPRPGWLGFFKHGASPELTNIVDNGIYIIIIHGLNFKSKPRLKRLNFIRPFESHPFMFIYSTTYITCPCDPNKTLGIKLPYLVMIVKNMNKYFTFEVQVSL